MNQAQIIAGILAAKPWTRKEMLEQIEREHGRGFRKAVEEAVDMHESDALIRSNEASIKRTRRKRR